MQLNRASTFVTCKAGTCKCQLCTFRILEMSRRSKRDRDADEWFSVTMSTINRRTEQVRRKREHLSDITLEGLSNLLQARIRSDEDAFSEISHLVTKVKSREDKIGRLREELAFLQGDELKELGEIQKRIQELKYQFQISQALLEQTEKELSFAEHRKINIINGDFRGDVTLKKVQKEGFLNLSSDNQHALEFLARELGMFITPGEITKSDVQEILNVASSSLIQLTSMRNQAEAVKVQVERKLQTIRATIEESKERREQLISEIVELQSSLLSPAPTIYSTIPRNKIAPEDEQSIRADMLHVLTVAGKDCPSQDLDEIAETQRRCILRRARQLTHMRQEHRFSKEMRTDSAFSPQIDAVAHIADTISNSNRQLRGWVG